MHQCIMMKHPRIAFTSTPPQKDWLEVEAARLGISVSELIRRLLDQVRGT